MRTSDIRHPDDLLAYVAGALKAQGRPVEAGMVVEQDMYGLKAPTSQKEKVIRWHSRFVNEEGEENEDGLFSTLTIWIGDLPITERIADVLTNLIRLRGGEPDPS